MTDPDRWASPEPGQVEVMLLGCYHMANPGNDTFNVDADDVLEPRRQRELEALTDRLATWQPDRIAVEQSADKQARLDERYRQYRSGDLDNTRNEVVQVGFRLADELDLDRVLAIDHQIRLDDRLEDGLSPDPDDVPTPDEVAYPLTDAEAEHREDQGRLHRSSIPEYLAWQNRASQLSLNHELLFAHAIDRTDVDVGSRVLATWYERNARTVHTLWNAIDADTDHVLVVIGSGHVRVLAHLLTEAPMFCPVSPLPLLPELADRNRPVEH